MAMYVSVMICGRIESNRVETNLYGTRKLHLLGVSGYLRIQRGSACCAASGDHGSPPLLLIRLLQSLPRGAYDQEPKDQGGGYVVLTVAFGRIIGAHVDRFGLDDFEFKNL